MAARSGGYYQALVSSTDPTLQIMMGEMCRLRVLHQLVVIISLIGQPGSAVRPVVTVNPNWNKIFIGESVSMTCDVKAAEETLIRTYNWYKNNVRQIEIFNSISTPNAQIADSGSYHCVVNGAYESEAVTLNVSDPIAGPVILQAPAFIYEGDEVPLRCKSPFGYHVKNTIFYKNNQRIQTSSSSNSYVIKSADSISSYHCSKEISGFPRVYSDNADIFYTAFPGILSVSLNPEWKKIRKGDSIKMMCYGAAGVTRYLWTQNNQTVAEGQNYPIPSAHLGHSGHYQCRTNRGNSPTFTLEVSDAPVILQTPLHVVQGRDLTLRCHSRPEDTVRWTIYYRNDQIIYRTEGDVTEFKIPSYADVPGQYRCEKRLSQNKYTVYTDQASLSVRELFPRPNFTATPDRVVEGDTMTLICDTRLGPFRPEAQLQFAFYKESGDSVFRKKLVQGFSSSNHYVVQSAQVDHSGKYFCEVKHLIAVLKTSKVISIKIEELFSMPNITATPITILEGDNMTLTCDTRLSPLRPDTQLQFAFYRDQQELQGFSSSAQYEVRSTNLNDSGHYYCDVRSKTSNVSKMSQEVPIQIQSKEPDILTTIVILVVVLLLLIIIIIIIVMIIVVRKSQHKPPETSASNGQMFPPDTGPPVDPSGEEDVCYADLKLSQKVSAPQTGSTSGEDINYANLAIKQKSLSSPSTAREQVVYSELKARKDT